MKRLQVDFDKCTGCGLCQLVCAVKHDRQLNPVLARIKIYRYEPQGLNLPLICQQCAHPPCAAACLMNVITKDAVTGATVRDQQNCIGCRLCQAACPFEAGTYDYDRDVVLNCDLCGGQPACVEICPTGALQYLDIDMVLDQARAAEAVKWVSLPERERSPHG